jgi:ABC-type transport system involved in multi-copper enzyme maturation permease subunit
MWNQAIFLKTLKDSFVPVALCAIAIMAFQIVFVWAMLEMGTDLLQFVSKVPFLTKIFEISFGIKVDGEVSVNVLFAVCFTHAVVLSLAWSCMIAISTRISAGEIEKGTADLLLSLPVNRSEAYLSASAVWWLAAIVLSFCPIPGMWIALQFFETDQVVELSRFVAPAFNFLALNLAVGGIASLIASCLDRRSFAIGGIVAILLVSMVLKFVEPFIESFKLISSIGLMHYFGPVDVVRTGEWPMSDMVILGTAGATCWLISMFIFSRRDIPTA